MTSFSDAWKAAGEAQDDYDPRDGQHRVRLVDAGAFTARTSQRDKVKLVWQIIGTEDAGRQFTDFNDIDASNPTGVRIVREKLTLLGLDPEGIDDIDDLDHALFDLIGVVADITVRHKDGFTNTSVSRVITGESDVVSDTRGRTPETDGRIGTGPDARENGGEMTPRRSPSFAEAAKSDDDVPF